MDYFAVAFEPLVTGLFVAAVVELIVFVAVSSFDVVAALKVEVVRSLEQLVAL